MVFWNHIVGLYVAPIKSWAHKVTVNLRPTHFRPGSPPTR